MPDTPLCTLEALAAAVPNGAMLAIPKDASGAAMAATRELVRRKVRDLHLLCVPISGIQADILIGAGCVSTIETSAVSLGEFGTASRFVAALKDNNLRIVDSTCPAIYAALQAGQKGLPFIPLRGLRYRPAGQSGRLEGHRQSLRTVRPDRRPQGDPA